MFVYISGKTLNVYDNQILLKLPNGLGYLIQVDPLSKIQVNENIDLYILSGLVGTQTLYYGFDTFEAWNISNVIHSKGIALKQSAELVWSLGVAKIHQSIIQKDDSFLKKIEGLGAKGVNKILEIEDQDIPVARINISNKKLKEDGSEYNTEERYSPAEFTQRLASLGYSRSRIVQIISVLKKENLWGNMPLVDLIKKAMEILEQKI
jgi:Holliday junction resolvasome RuvABC DNA-binding subunit